MRVVNVSKKIFIERHDFRKEENDIYFGLSPGKVVALRHFAVIQCTDYQTD